MLVKTFTVKISIEEKSVCSSHSRKNIENLGS